jgi:hypothetical protein
MSGGAFPYEADVPADVIRSVEEVVVVRLGTKLVISEVA